MNNKMNNSGYFDCKITGVPVTTTAVPYMGPQPVRANPDDLAIVMGKLYAAMNMLDYIRDSGERVLTGDEDDQLIRAGNILSELFYQITVRQQGAKQ